MRFYVAGKTHDYKDVRYVMDIVREQGHTITYDWTAVIESLGGNVNEVLVPREDRQRYAELDMLGVADADITIACGNPNVCGTLWECGATIVLRKPLWLLWWDRCSRHSVFEDFPTVRQLKDIPELRQRLEAVHA